MIEAYLTRRSTLSGVIQLLDVRHNPNRADVDTTTRLQLAGKPFCLVFNKIDKLKSGHVAPEIAGHLGSLSLDPVTPVVPFSSRSPAGNHELWSWIEERLSL